MSANKLLPLPRRLPRGQKKSKFFDMHKWFKAEKGPPLPLADMSTKNVSFFGTASL